MTGLFTAERGFFWVTPPTFSDAKSSLPVSGDPELYSGFTNIRFSKLLETPFFNLFGKDIRVRESSGLAWVCDWDCPCTRHNQTFRSYPKFPI